MKDNNGPIFMIGLGAILVILDQLTKLFFIGKSMDFGWIALSYVENTGISFGLFQGTSLIIIFLSIIVLYLLHHYRKEFIEKEIFLLLITCGIIGNLIDRVFRGFVIDFIDLKWWPVFNLADSMIFVGVVGFIAMSLFYKPVKAKNTIK